MGNSGQTPVTLPWARETPGTQSLGEDWVPVESRRLHEAGGTLRDFAHIPGSPDSAGGQAHPAGSRLPRARRPRTPTPSGTRSFGFPPQVAVSLHPLRPPPARALLRSSAAPTFDFPARSLQRERRPRPSTLSSAGTIETPDAGQSGSSSKRRRGRRDTGPIPDGRVPVARCTLVEGVGSTSSSPLSPVRRPLGQRGEKCKVPCWFPLSNLSIRSWLCRRRAPDLAVDRRTRQPYLRLGSWGRRSDLT